MCQVLGQSRSTQRYAAHIRDDEIALTKAIVYLARRYGRNGYRQITALLKAEGWRVNQKRVERIWRHRAGRFPGNNRNAGDSA